MAIFFLFMLAWSYGLPFQLQRLTSVMAALCDWVYCCTTTLWAHDFNSFVVFFYCFPFLKFILWISRLANQVQMKPHFQNTQYSVQKLLLFSFSFAWYNCIFYLWSDSATSGQHWSRFGPVISPVLQQVLTSYCYHSSLEMRLTWLCHDDYYFFFDATLSSQCRTVCSESEQSSSLLLCCLNLCQAFKTSG